MIGTIFYVGTKTQQKIYWTDFGVGLKDVSNSTLITCTFIILFLEVKGWHDRNKRSLNYHTHEHQCIFMIFAVFGENQMH